ncbi:MAG: hypothetical protein AVDCRST_MAG11-3772, partial [uncultured Gemmatimonadaceae bacterium]
TRPWPTGSGSTRATSGGSPASATRPCSRSTCATTTSSRTRTRWRTWPPACASGSSANSRRPSSGRPRAAPRRP